MSHYVLSDLHGERERFHQMLQTIEFSESDTLYILGDVVDRGPDPIGLLQEILDTPNMTLLLGNHEYMCLQCYSPEATETDWRRWNRNNNLPTRSGLDALEPDARKKLLDAMRCLPVHVELTVNGQRYYLVHGFPAGTLHDEVWNRPEPDTPTPIPGVRVIVGHTPICCLGRDEEQEEAYNRELAARGEKMRIFHAPGFIDLDCGCGYEIPTKALSCLRLEDGREYNV